MYIIYFYILVRYLIVLGLIISSVVFFVKTIKQRRPVLLIGFIVPLMIVSWMFFYGLVRKPVLDIEELCLNFDTLCNEDVIESDSLFITFGCEPEELINEIREGMNTDDKLLSGTIDNVQYLASYMYSDMLDPKNLGTYCGTYSGEVLLTKENKSLYITYIVSTSQKDPRAIFYSFKPSKIKISDYINQGINQ